MIKTVFDYSMAIYQGKKNEIEIAKIELPGIDRDYKTYLNFIFLEENIKTINTKNLIIYVFKDKETKDKFLKENGLKEDIIKRYPMFLTKKGKLYIPENLEKIEKKEIMYLGDYDMFFRAN
jgi:hypothetical protein